MVIEKLFRLFEKSGVMLDETKRLRVSEINNEIVKLGKSIYTNYIMRLVMIHWV